jgi:hypothetical protein
MRRGCVLRLFSEGMTMEVQVPETFETVVTQTEDTAEARAEIDRRLTALRGRITNVTSWYAQNPMSLVPPLSVRGDMMSIAVEAQQLDLWMSEGGILPTAWRQQRDNGERPELVREARMLMSTTVSDFMRLVSPVSIPQDLKAARALLAEWLTKHAWPIEGDRLGWEIRVVHNGRFVVRTGQTGMVRSIRYEAL